MAVRRRPGRRRTAAAARAASATSRRPTRATPCTSSRPRSWAIAFSASCGRAPARDPARALPTAVGDGPQPVGAVVERAGEDDAGGARAVAARRSPEQRVDRRPMAVLVRAEVTRTGSSHEQVAVGRGDEDSPGTTGSPSTACRAGSGPAGRGCRGARSCRSRDVQDHAHRRLEVGRERGRESPRNASTPPAEAPTTITSRRGVECAPHRSSSRGGLAAKRAAPVCIRSVAICIIRA